MLLLVSLTLDCPDVYALRHPASPDRLRLPNFLSCVQPCALRIVSLWSLIVVVYSIICSTQPSSHFSLASPTTTIDDE